MAKEEYILKLSMLQQEAGKIEEQINAINQHVNELGILKLSLNDVKQEKEILAPLGKGIFFKSKVEDEKVFVNIGENIIVRRNSEEAGKIINKQVIRLEEFKLKLINEIEKINQQLQSLFEEIQKEA